jgi:hypothetical protein
VECKGKVWNEKESTVVWSERTLCGYHEVEEGWDVRPYSLFHRQDVSLGINYVLFHVLRKFHL